MRPAQSVVVSAAPTKYSKSETNKNIDEELNNFLSEIKQEEEEMERNKRLKSGAKVMADSVKASTTVSFHPVVGGADSTGKGKKEKKNKKLIRMAGGQTWEDPSLTEWEDGKIYLYPLFLFWPCQIKDFLFFENFETFLSKFPHLASMDIISYQLTD